MKKVIFIILLSMMVGTEAVFAEEILTTRRGDADQTIFDGKWTFQREWKSTSEDLITFDDGYKMSIRTGHDYENLYVLVDFISDTSIQKISDRAIVCIDSENDGGSIPRSDDYCFMVSVGSSRPITLQGGHFLAQTGYWKKIENHQNLIAIGGVSDNNDRYSLTPHATYEFKIPLEIFERSDIYGFYVGAYEARANKEYSWPQGIALERYPYVGPPEMWGKLISPDKSIPEFNWPLITLLPALVLVLYFTKSKTGLVSIDKKYTH